MSLSLEPMALPLQWGDSGDIRVCGSRIFLDDIVRRFENGDSPEIIVQHYPTLPLADVYAVVAFYLRHRQEIDPYLRQRREEALELKKKIEGSQPWRANLREELLAR